MCDYLWKDIDNEIEKIECDINFDDCQLVLFGAGMNGEFALDQFKTKNIPIYYSDNNKSLWNKKVNGIEVISPDEITKLSNPFVIITTGPQYYNSVSEQLKMLKVSFISHFKYEVLTNYEKYKFVYNNCLTDEKSKKYMYT